MIGRNRYNTQLPPLKPTGAQTAPWLSPRYLLGLVFVAMVFLVVVFFVYEAQYGQQGVGNSDDVRICTQVITPARNIETGAVRDFPTLCDVPEGWEVIPPQSTP